MPRVCAPVASNELEVPPTVNEVGESERRELMFSDRKASKVLGATVLRVPRPTIDRKASKILGADVAKSGIDWDMRVNGGRIGPRKDRLREKFLQTKVAPLILRWSEGERIPGKEGQKVVLSPKRKSSRMLRRHTISYESGLHLLLPSPPPSPTPSVETLGPTTQTFAELLPEDVGEGGCLGLDSGVVSDDSTISQMETLVDLGIIPPPVPSSRPSSSIDLSAPSQPYGVLVSPTRGNPVIRKRREMIRSANKSVQILGIEARRAILKKMERENAGRIGWSGV